LRPRSAMFLFPLNSNHAEPTKRNASRGISAREAVLRAPEFFLRARDHFGESLGIIGCGRGAIKVWFVLALKNS
jgi:hypothetical protein